MARPRLVVAQVRGLHGLQGAVRVEVLTDRPEARFAEGAGPAPRGRRAAAHDRRRAARRGRAGLAPAVPRGAEPRRRPSASARRTSRSRSIARRTSSRVPPTGTRSSARPFVTPTGAELGKVADVYRAGETEVYVVRGGPAGEFDVPAVRDVITTFAPERGELVVDESGPGPRRRAGRRPAPGREREAPAPRRAGPRHGQGRATPPRTRAAAALDAASASAPDSAPDGDGRDARDRRRLPVPGHARGAAVREHSRAHPGARARRRSASMTSASGASGGTAASTTRRTAGSGHGPPARAGRRALDALRRPDSTVDPARRRRRGLPPGAGRRPGEPIATSSCVCPRYEGVDERIRDLVDLELSIGDYVLTGGELAALVVIDAVTRLLPGRDRRRIDGRGVVQRRAARVPAVHPTRRVPRPRRAGRPRERPPRGGPPLAPRRGRRADDGAAARTCCPRRAEPAAHRPGWAGGSWYRSPPSAAGRSPTRHPPAPPRAATRQEPTTVNVLDEIVADQIRTDLPGARLGRHGQGVGQGRRGRQGADPGLRRHRS